MKNMVKDEKKLALLILGLVCIGYFLFLFRFYNIEYYVPDFRGYNLMAARNHKAADGFSSLFIWMASLCSIMPKFMTFASLAMLCFSIFNILLFYYDIFWENMQKFVLAIVICMSCGAWYYFYGKVFYDVPFSVFNYSLCLLAFAKLYKNRENSKNARVWWYILIYLLGLMMSWKPYNIFMLAGAGLLILAYDDFRKEVLAFLKGIRRILFSIVVFFAGYVTGNFNILLFPHETIEGIKAYKASFPFGRFMLDKHRVIWDHVNDLPFAISVFSVVMLVFVGVIWPIAIKKFRYILVSLFMFGALNLYITYFSPGYTWHGFSYGFYVITYILFLIKETGCRTEKSNIFRIMLAVSVAVQCSVNFGYYIPTQTRWAAVTKESLEVLGDRESEIYKYVSEQIEGFGESTYMIDNAVKRFRPYYNSALDLRPVSLEQPYIVAENVAFADPLQYANYDEWDNLYKRSNYLGKADECDYIIYIIPNVFKCMNDVARVRLYNKKNKVNVIQEADYTIYVYSNVE